MLSTDLKENFGLMYSQWFWCRLWVWTDIEDTVLWRTRSRFPLMSPQTSWYSHYSGCRTHLQWINELLIMLFRMVTLQDAIIGVNRGQKQSSSKIWEGRHFGSALRIISKLIHSSHQRWLVSVERKYMHTQHTIQLQYITSVMFLIYTA